MRNKVNLFWYRLNQGHGNFGDEVNPYLIEKLSGCKVTWDQPYFGTKWESVKTVLFMILKEHKNIKYIVKLPVWRHLTGRRVIFAIGSIIRFANNDVLVWGSGIISKDEHVPKSKFLAVRGKYTKQRLLELGYKVGNVVGDPALLLPKVFAGSALKKYKVGVIPHHIHYQSIKEKMKDADVLIINLLDPVEKVISDITSCEFTLSTSLHGIIVSHAYKIGSLWIVPKNIMMERLSGDDIKFADYFSSVDLTEYRAFPIDLTHFSLQELAADIRKYGLPGEDKITIIQNGLLQVAPFRILSKYRP